MSTLVLAEPVHEEIPTEPTWRNRNIPWNERAALLPDWNTYEGKVALAELVCEHPNVIKERQEKALEREIARCRRQARRARCRSLGITCLHVSSELIILELASSSPFWRA